MRGRGVEPILFLALGTIWGSAYLAVKVGGGGVGPFEFVALRLAIGAAFLGAIVALRRERLPALRDWPHVVVVGLVGLAIPFVLLTWGQRGVDAGLASIFNATTPLFIVGLAAVALADEPLRAGRLVGIAVGFGGIVLVAGGGIAAGGAPMSIAAIALATFSYAVNAVYARRFLRHVRPLGLAMGQAIVGLGLTAGLAAVVEGPSLVVPPPQTLAALAWLGILASGVAPLLFFRLNASWGANRTALVNYLIPIVGVVAGALLLGEGLELRTLVGGGIVVAGMAIAARSPELGLPAFLAASRQRFLPAFARAGSAAGGA